MKASWDSERAWVLFPMWIGYAVGVVVGVLVWPRLPTAAVGFFIGGVAAAIFSCTRRAR